MKVGVADHPEQAARSQRSMGVPEHPLGGLVANRVILVERRIAEDQLERAGSGALAAVRPAELRRAGGEAGFVIGSCALPRPSTTRRRRRAGLRD